ncbi:Uma2 family endonuclease [Streptomyces sp. Ru87]|uniref:Uma2 family endonuclease n=1 Tax=Streptomyces sp. Ru87 TaxID=2044307 RepID=UPI000BFA4F14|nr:Uma2 family endonuclease [Streptomyces sp. Ru87]PGH48561.1 restriction endonuclease [Streptomyces sp. Ru87]
MSALTVDPGPTDGYGWEDLVRLREEMEWPEGCKVEIIEGIITVSPPASSDHNNIADDIQRLLYTVIPRSWGIFQTQGVAVPGRQGIYIPDLAVMPKEALATARTDIPAGVAELVVEITSRTNAGQDRISKPAGYAQAGVPLYLLVDAWAPGGPTVTLFGEPKGDVYRVLQAGKFGDPVRLPEPFDVVIDTGVFVVG